MRFTDKILPILKKSVYSLFSELIKLFSYLISILFLYVNFVIALIENLINLQSISKNIKIEFHLQKNEKSFNFSEYKTTTAMFPTWVDKLFSSTKYSNLFLSIMVSVFIYLLGMSISSFIGFQLNYIKSIPIYLGLIGITIALFIIRYGSTKIHKSYYQLRPCFMISDIQYKNFLNNWFSKLSNIRSTINLSIFLSILFISVTFIGFYYYESLETLQFFILKPKIFQIQGWYDYPFKFVKFLLICIYAIGIAFPLATAGRILFINFFFLLDLQYLPIIPIPNLLRTRLRGVTDLYMLITFFWFVGALLFVVLFYKDSNFISTLIIIGISFLGFLTFITPQIIYHSLLKRSEHTASKWILASFYKKMDVTLIEDCEKIIISPQDAGLRYNLTTFVDYLDASAPTNRWVYSHAQVFLFIMGQIVTFIVSNYQPIIKNLMKI